MPPPDIVRHPRARASRSSSVSSGKYTMSATQNSGRSNVSGNGHARIVRHAERGGVDDAVGRGQRRPRDRVARRRATAPNRSLRAAARRSARSPSVSTIVTSPASEGQQCMGNRRTGPACAELNDAVSRGRLATRCGTLGEAHQSVLCPTRRPSFSTTVLTAPSARRLGREFIQQRDHGLLAGMGDVEACEAEALGRGEDFRQGALVDAERVQIDQLVDVAKSLLGALPFVQSRRSGRLDAGTHQSDENRRTATAVAPSRLATGCGCSFVLHRGVRRLPVECRSRSCRASP